MEAALTKALNDANEGKETESQQFSQSQEGPETGFTSSAYRRYEGPDDDDDETDAEGTFA